MKILGFGEENKTSLEKQRVTTSKNMTTLQSGDKFKATILDIKRNEITIKLSDGNVITAKSLIIPDAHIGDSMEFTVQANKDGQILLSMISKEQSNQQQINTLLNILSSAGIVPSDEAVEVVKTLIENGLPVDKNSIQNTVQTLKANPQLDMETLAFMLKEDIAITSENINQIKLTTHNELQLKNQIDELAFKLVAIDEPQIKKEVLSIFLPELMENSDAEAVHQLKNFVLTKQQNILDNIEPELKTNFIEISNLIVDKATEIIKNGGDIKQVIEMISMAEILPKDASEKIMTAVKDFLNLLLEFEFTVKEPKAELIAKFIKESLFIDIKLPQDLNNYYQQLYEKITKTLSTTEKGNSENTREASKILSEIKNNIEFMNNINKFQEFIQIPFRFGDTDNQANLYIFNDKKGNKISKDKASVLLALDLSMLGHFEVFIQKDFKNISCQFRTVDKKIQSLVQINMPKLQFTLKQKGYNLSNIVYKTIQEPFNILQTAQEANFENEQIQQTNKRYSFDMRA